MSWRAVIIQKRFTCADVPIDPPNPLPRFNAVAVKDGLQWPPLTLTASGGFTASPSHGGQNYAATLAESDTHRTVAFGARTQDHFITVLEECARLAV